MPRMTRIPSDLRRWGLPVHLVKGWETRGSSSFAPAIVRNHWTGTTQRKGVNLPTLNVLVKGHGSLPGPLCQVAHGRDGSCTVVAAGRANDGGKGLWKGVTGNSGGYGIESEASGPTSWTAAQRFTYPIVVAALLHGLGRGADHDASHAEFARPSGRKQDINGWPDGGMTGFRRRVAALLAAGPDASPLHHYPSVDAAIAALGPDPVPVRGTAPTPAPEEDDDMTPEQATRQARIEQKLDALLKIKPGLTEAEAEQANAIYREVRSANTNATAVRADLLPGGRTDAKLTNVETQGGQHTQLLVQVLTGRATRDQLAGVLAAVEGLPAATVDQAAQRVADYLAALAGDVDVTPLPPVEIAPAPCEPVDDEPVPA